MKKIIALLLVFIMVLPLTACSGGDQRKIDFFAAVEGSLVVALNL